MMRRIGLTAIALVIVMFVVGAGARTNPVGVNGQGGGRTGKALVKKLPAGLEGVQLRGNIVRVKPGYKFVKQADGTVTVARIKSGSGGGPGLGGKWSCDCDAPGKGTCETSIGDDALYCSKATCSSSCTLRISTTNATVGIVRY
jgi:hypothetical protein